MLSNTGRILALAAAVFFLGATPLVADELADLGMSSPPSHANSSHAPAVEGPAWRLSLKPGLTSIANGITLMGASTELSFRVSRSVPFYLGVETGYYYNNTGLGLTSYYSPYPTYSPASLIPVMATAYYRFELGSAFHPFLGVAAGAAFTNGMLSLNLPPTSGSYLTPSTYFQGLVRPGVEFDLMPAFSLGFEPRFGVLSYQSYSAFTFSPTINLSFGF